MNLDDFFRSVFIGISVAAIPGPIFFELVRRTLSRGFAFGSLLSVGEFFGNFLLLSLIFLGVSNFFTQTIVKEGLFLCGALVLGFLGVSALRLKRNDVELSYGKAPRGGNSIVVGFLISLSSPIVVALWISLSGSYLATFATAGVVFLHIFLVAFGIMVFYFGLATLLYLTRSRISPRYVVSLSKIFGLVLLGYSFYFLYQLALLILR